MRSARIQGSNRTRRSGQVSKHRQAAPEATDDSGHVASASVLEKTALGISFIGTA
jgi:hypothetical protein